MNETLLIVAEIKVEITKSTKKRVILFILCTFPLNKSATTIKTIKHIAASSIMPAYGKPTNFSMAVPNTLKKINKEIIILEYDNECTFIYTFDMGILSQLTICFISCSFL